MTALTCGCDLKAGFRCPKGQQLYKDAERLLLEVAKLNSTMMSGADYTLPSKALELAKIAYEAHITAVVESSP